MTDEQRAERRKRFSHLGVEVPREMHDRIKSISKSKEITASEFVRKALSKYLAEF